MSPFIIWGQDKSDSLLITTLDSITVTATRYIIPLNSTPFAITTQANIDSDQPISLKEIFNKTSGLVINTRNNKSQGDKLLLRGIGTRSAFGVRGIKLILDGIPLTFTDGQSQLNNLDYQFINKLEVIKGPSSTLYGNSLGGVININSFTNSKENYNISPRLSIGSYGLKKYSIISNGKLLDGQFSLGAYAAVSNGFRDHSKSKDYGAKLNFKINLSNSLKLSFTSNYYNAPYLLNPSSLNKYDAENNPKTVRNSVKTFSTGKKISQFQNGINLQLSITPESKIRTMFYGVTRSLKNSIPGRIIELNRFFGGFRMEADNKIILFNKSINTLLGIDFEIQKDDRKEFENGGLEDYSNLDPNNIFEQIKYNSRIISQDENVRSIGVFSHLNFNLTNRIKLFAGLRFDDYKFNVKERLSNEASSNISMNNLSEMIGFNYKINTNLTLHGNYSNGFQTPTTNELSNNPFRDGGFNDLKPEIINSFELGAKWWLLTPQIISNISIYNMNISNMLISYQSSDEQNYYRNAGKANNIGVEFDFEVNILSNWTFNTVYNFMNFKFEDYIIEDEANAAYQLKNKYLPGVPKHNILISSRYVFPFNFIGRIDFRWTDKYFTNDFNGSKDGKEDIDDYINDAFSLWNSSLQYSFKLNKIKIFLKMNVENLLNTRYNDSIIPNAFGKNYFEPASGRTYYFTLSALI